jgi:hypothetical protein
MGRPTLLQLHWSSRLSSRDTQLSLKCFSKELQANLFGVRLQLPSPGRSYVAPSRVGPVLRPWALTGASSTNSGLNFNPLSAALEAPQVGALTSALALTMRMLPPILNRLGNIAPVRTGATS